jgi:hypothetical protein
MNKRLVVAIVIFAIFIIWLYYLTNVKECVKARAAFDLGSGGFKSEIALVNACTNKFIKVIDDKLHPLKMANCLLKDEVNNMHLSDTCIDKTVDALLDIEKTYKVNCHEVQCIGVATEWARQVDNEEVLFEKLRDMGLNIKEIDQEKEGLIAFKSVVDQLDSNKYNKDQIVVWDLGGASFQLSTLVNSELQVYNGRIGVEVFDRKIRELIGRPIDSAHPYFSVKEFEVIAKNVDSLIEFNGIIHSDAYKKLKSGSKLIAVGAPFSRNLVSEMGFDNFITKEQLLTLIKSYENKKVADIKKAYPKLNLDYIRTNQTVVILVYLILSKLGADSVIVADTTLTRGLFTMEEFW